MSAVTVAGLLLIAVPLAFNAAFTLLAARFDYPDILRQPTYLGVAVGEHLGYALTGAWTTLTGIAPTQTAAVPSWIGVPGVVFGPALMLCSLEFVGGHEPAGWRLAGHLARSD